MRRMLWRIRIKRITGLCTKYKVMIDLVLFVRHIIQPWSIGTWSCILCIVLSYSNTNLKYRNICFFITKTERIKRFIQNFKKRGELWSTYCVDFIGGKQDCWICYDPDRTDVGSLIQPCQCRGDVSSVHHECLRKWLIEVRYKFEVLMGDTYY